MRKTSIIISISSDIGTALAKHWAESKNIIGTYRTKSPELDRLESVGIQLEKCDLSDCTSINQFCQKFREKNIQWDELIFCPGLLSPIGLFESLDINEWQNTFNVNFSAQINILHQLLDLRNKSNNELATALFFAGGGTNGTAKYFSSYTVSKIALIKMCELLDHEIDDCKFSIMGPGWVKTKIHQQTIEAKASAKEAYHSTKEHYKNNNFNDMNDVIDCCDWIINSDKNIVGGRNFSMVHDAWRKEKLASELGSNNDMYKLRRYGNDLIV